MILNVVGNTQSSRFKSGIVFIKSPQASSWSLIPKLLLRLCLLNFHDIVAFVQHFQWRNRFLSLHFFFFAKGFSIPMKFRGAIILFTVNKKERNLRNKSQNWFAIDDDHHFFKSHFVNASNYMYLQELRRNL